MMRHLIAYTMWTPEHPLRRELVVEQQVRIDTQYTRTIQVGHVAMPLAPGPILVERKE